VKGIIPNLLTLTNLASGMLAILLVLEGNFMGAGVLLAIALLCDFLDGFVARLLGVHSELGKQLDSLADMVTFGVLPGFILYKLFGMAHTLAEPFPAWLDYLAFLVPVFSALRLAKFNIDTRQSEHFIGLPTPANALFIYSLALIVSQSDNPSLNLVLLHPFLLSALAVVCSLLLVAELPLIALKFKNVELRENAGRFLLIAACLVLFIVFRLRALAFVIPLYLLLSLIFKPNRK
jgi:CDP-diacylglycerol--serine O-phosphatidyltransferase